MEKREIDLLNLGIAKFYPNLRTIHTIYCYHNFDTLKAILDSCQYLENIRVDISFLDTKELFEILAKNSSRYFHELHLCHPSEFSKKDLEEFLIIWKNRIPLSLFVIGSRYAYDGYDKIFEKYKKLGVAKKFEITDY